MKKQYRKPDIMFETFSLNTSIAAGCERKTATPALFECGFKFGSEIVYTDTMYGCSDIRVDGSLLDGFCYHNPCDANNLFNS